MHAEKAILRSFDRTNEPIASRHHSCYESRLTNVIPKDAPQLCNCARRRILGDGNILPHRIQQFVLGNQLLRMMQKILEDKESLRFKLERFARPDHREFPFSNFEVGKAKNKALLLRHETVTRLQRTVKRPSRQGSATDTECLQPIRLRSSLYVSCHAAHVPPSRLDPCSAASG